MIFAGSFGHYKRDRGPIFLLNNTPGVSGKYDIIQVEIDRNAISAHL